MSAPARRRPRLSFTLFFVLGALVILGAAAAVFAAFFESSRGTVLAGAERSRANAASQVNDRVLRALSVAQDAVGDVSLALNAHVADSGDPLSLEALLFSTLLPRKEIAEVTFIHADVSGWTDDGDAVVGPDGKWALSVVRATPEADAPIQSVLVTQRDGGFASQTRTRPVGGAFASAPFVAGNGAAADPTLDLTFQTTAGRRFADGTPIWSDLHWFEIDDMLPETKRRITVSVQAQVQDAGKVLGVVRVAMRAEAIDEVRSMKVFPDDPADPDIVFVADNQGRLVTRLAPSDAIASMDGDLRVDAKAPPPPVAKAVKSALLAAPDVEDRTLAEAFVVNGEPFLATYRGIPETQDWRVVIVGPEAYYTKDLRTLRDRALLALGAVFAVAFAGGALGLRALRRGLGQVEARAARMRAFDFAAVSERSPFRDIDDVMDGLERAKTVTRALGKYVPVDLVRKLFESNKDPTLGGELRTLSIMFTDIKDFTSLAERIAPDVLARALGKYLDAMTGAVAAEGGTIDKFIGDAVMAFWNAPESCRDHAVRACRAALASEGATARLYASAEWTDLPPLVTRCGLHTADVMVGHFGAPARLSYTALGDGVNLASRLEGLCKQYDVTVLASEAVVEVARSEFEFRLVDRVAVKGKSRAVRVYELLGARGACDARLPAARAYEQAFAAYERRAFGEALTLLGGIADDGPSRALSQRCKEYLEEPPPDDWDGTAHSQTK